MPKEYFVRREKTGDYLDDLAGNAPAEMKTVSLAPGLSDKAVSELFVQSGIAGPPDKLVAIASESACGGFLYAAAGDLRFIIPPFPVAETVIFAGCETAPLRELIEKDCRVGIVLVHLGSYAVGVCRREEILSSKIGTGLVHGRTRKGGSSSGRFQRRRQNQAKEFLDRVCLHAREQFAGEGRSPEFVVFGGPRQTVGQLVKQCPVLGGYEDRTLPPLDVPRVRREVLDDAVGRIWSCRVLEWKTSSPEDEA